MQGDGHLFAEETLTNEAGNNIYNDAFEFEGITKDGHYLSKGKEGTVFIDKKALPLLAKLVPTGKKNEAGFEIFHVLP